VHHEVVAQKMPPYAFTALHADIDHDERLTQASGVDEPFGKPRIFIEEKVHAGSLSQVRCGLRQ
jgi:hypothetical protein